MPASDRRHFFRQLLGAGAALIGTGPARPRAVAVSAVATPFYAQPDGQRCLVRFLADGLEAPAGRLRVFDAARRPLGTAGMLPSGDRRLYGELWLPVSALGRIRTELTAPGLSGPIGNWLEVAPGPRWTVRWLAVLDPGELAAALERLPPVPRAVELRLLQAIGARINPWPGSQGLQRDELSVIRRAEAARRSAEGWGIPLSPVALVQEEDVSLSTLPSVLLGIGVGVALWLEAAEAGRYRWQARDGSLLHVVAIARESQGMAPVLGASLDRAALSLERWLAAAPVLGGPPASLGPSAGRRAGGEERHTVLVSTAVSGLAEAWAGVREWNARFAYPRFVTGDVETLVRELEAGSGWGSAPWLSRPARVPVPPLAAAVEEQAGRRAAEQERRAAAMIETLVRLLPERRSSGLAAVAEQLAFAVPGTLVFNPTAYSRSDLVRLADGTERVVTDVPPLGYAYVPLGSAGGASWQPAAEASQPLRAVTGQFAVELDPGTGAIQSLVRAGGGECSRVPRGLNALAGARLEDAVREVLPGVGARIVARRRLPSGAMVRSTVTVYDALPFVDVVNEVEAGGEEVVACEMDFALEVALASWDIPAGWEEARPPASAEPLRWVRLAGAGGAVTLASLEWAAVTVEAGGLVTTYGPRRAWRQRIAVGSGGPAPQGDDPWVLGWGLEPLVTAPVPGTGGATLPSFGSLLVLDQPGVVVLGLEPGQRERSVVIYLQEVTGRTRAITLGAGLVGFEDARLVNLVGQEQGSPAWAGPDAVGVVLPGGGILGLELLGVRLVRP